MTPDEQIRTIIRCEIISQPGITKAELIKLLKLFDDSQVRLVDYKSPSE